jgi:capsular exopolysaccharide synthesis family protein
MDALGAQRAARSAGTPGGVDHLGVIGRHRWLTILIVGWALGLAALYSFTRPTVYTAEAAVEIGPGVVTSIDPGQAEVNPETESQVVESTEVAERAAEELAGTPSVSSMLNRVSVDVPENTEVLRILFSAGTPVEAAEGANAFAAAYLGYRGDQAESVAAAQVSRLQTKVQELQSQIDDALQQRQGLEPGDPQYGTLTDDIQSLSAQRAFFQTQVLQWQTTTIDPGQVIASALPPTSPSSPNHALDLALGAIVGLGLAFGLAYIRDRKATGFESATELEDVLGVPVMAVIPSFRDERIGARDPIALYRSGGPISDGYRTLRAAVLARAERSRLVTIAVTSARSGEGKSMTAAMLAIALASAGRRVILIDGDLRRPMVSKLGFDDRRGLADVLAARVDSVLDTMQSTAIEGLSVVASGRAGPSSDPAELLQSDRMRKVLEDCGFADFVVLDTPAVLAVADGLVLAPLTDGVLFVASARDTTTQALDFAKLQLTRIGADIIGSVLVGVRRPEGQELGYYYRLDRPGVRLDPLGKAPEAEPRRAVGRGTASPPEPVLGGEASDADAPFLDDVGAFPADEEGSTGDPQGVGSTRPHSMDERADPASRRGAGAVPPIPASDPSSAAIDSTRPMPPVPATPPAPAAPERPSAGAASSSRTGTKKRRGSQKKPPSAGRRNQGATADPERSNHGSAADRGVSAPSIETSTEGANMPDQERGTDDPSAEQDPQTTTTEGRTGEPTKKEPAPAEATAEPSSPITDEGRTPETDRSSTSTGQPSKRTGKKKDMGAPRSRTSAAEGREDPQGTGPAAGAATAATGGASTEEDGVTHDDREDGADEPPAEQDAARATSAEGRAGEPTKTEPAPSERATADAGTSITGADEARTSESGRSSKSAGQVPKRTRKKTDVGAPRSQDSAAEGREDSQGAAPAEDAADQSEREAGGTP